MTFTSMTHVKLTPMGRDKHEQFGFNRPYSTIAGALYASSTGLSIEDISRRTGISEGTVKEATEVLRRNHLVEVQGPDDEGNKSSSEIPRLSL